MALASMLSPVATVAPFVLLAGLLAGALCFAFFAIWRPYSILMRLRRQGIPTTPFRPVVGHLPEYHEDFLHAGMGTEPGERDEKFVDVFRENEKKYGPLVAMSLGPHVRLIISDPALQRQVLMGNSQEWPKDSLQRRALALFGNGLINSNGPLWSRQRRMMNPSFGHRHIKEVLRVMVSSSQQTVDSWKEQIKNSNGLAEIDVQKDASSLALEIIGQSAFGANISGGSEQAREIYETVAEILEATIDCIVRGYVFIPLYKRLPLKLIRTIAKCERKIRTLMLGLIERRRKAQIQGVVGDDLLASMLMATDDETNIGMTNEQLMDECLNILLAGHETTAQLITWSLYLLSRHPEWQTRLREEVNSVIWSDSEKADWEKAASLKELQMVLMESLRLFPPIPGVMRGVEKEMKLGPYSIPKGTSVFVPISHLHRKKDLWGEDADTFRPERFADGVAGACKDPHVFVPFSAGPRNCIGQAFAMMEAKVILAHILRDFSWSLAPGFKHSTQALITLRPSHGMPMLVRRIENHE